MIPEEQEPELDLDWFALDADGAVGHFTTGGCGALPRIVAASREDLDSVARYFAELPETTRPIINANRSITIPLYPSVKPEPAAALRPWTRFAARGLYSYDFIDDRRRRPRPYVLVARPELALHADDLSPDVRLSLSRIVLKSVSFASDEVVPLSALLPG